MWLIIGFIIVGLLAWVLSRRGSTGMSRNGSTDTVESGLGRSLPWRDNGPAGF